MSLYNMLFGTNPAAEMLLAMINLTREETGRFRDCYLSDDGTEILVYTRNGGGNRDSYQVVFDAMSKHPNFLGDSDDDFDCTYATIRFSVPSEFKEVCKLMADQSDTRTGAQKLDILLSDLDSKKDNATVSRALDIGKRIFGAIQSNKSENISNQDGSISVIQTDSQNQTPK